MEVERLSGAADYVLVYFPKGIFYVAKIVGGYHEQGRIKTLKD